MERKTMGPTIVLGMHRSGTSLVAAILRRLGIYMGEDFREPDEWNKTGYFEDLAWRDINKELLNGAGGTWYDPPTPDAITQALSDNNALRYKIEELVAEHEQHVYWGFKDPRTCLTLHALVDFFDEPNIIYITRNQDAVVSSLMKRATGRGYYEEPVHWYKLSTVYNTRACHNIRLCKNDDDHLPVYIIKYETLTDRQTGILIVQAIADHIGVLYTISAYAAELIRYKDE